MIKKSFSLITVFLAFTLIKANAIDIDMFIQPANPIDAPINQAKIQRTSLTHNDSYNQYAIAFERYKQSNVKSSYTDFKMLIENSMPVDYLYIQMSDKMAELGFFDLSELSMSKVQDVDLSYLTFEDVKRFYFPKVKMSQADEIYLAEMFSNITYNDQSKEVVEELLKTKTLLEQYDYANYLVALGFFKCNDIKNADKYINVAISKNPENISYKKLKAEILAQTSKPKDALKLVNTIKSVPAKTSEFNKKIYSLEEYILYKTETNEFTKKYHLAYYFYYEDELNKSIRTLQTAFNPKKNNKDVYGLLSRVYYDLNEYKKAQDNVAKALKIDGSQPLALMVKGDLTYRQKDYKSALKYYGKASFKDSYQPQIQLAKTYQKLNNSPKAYEIYNKILKKSGCYYDVYYAMALLNSAHREEYLKKSVAINPQFKDGWLELVQDKISQNNYKLASKYLSILKYVDENDFRYYYYLGLVYKNNGLPADAKRSFRKSYTLNPDYAPTKEELSL